MVVIPNRDQIHKGSHVEIETKADQGTGRFTAGIVDQILTNSQSHPHGIKVKLADGQVGRVKRMGKPKHWKHLNQSHELLMILKRLSLNLFKKRLSLLYFLLN